MVNRAWFRTVDGEWRLVSKEKLDHGATVIAKRRKDGGKLTAHRVGRLVAVKGKTHYYEIWKP